MNRLRRLVVFAIIVLIVAPCWAAVREAPDATVTCAKQDQWYQIHLPSGGDIHNIVEKSEQVLSESERPIVLDRGSDYAIDYAKGMFKALAGGRVELGKPISLSLKYDDAASGATSQPSVKRIDSTDAARVAQEDAAKQLGRPVEWTNSVGIKFRLIPAGQFEMGQAGGAADAPHRIVRITKPYYIGVTEITHQQWETVTSKKQSFYYAGPNRPMNYVCWYDVDEFLAALITKETRAKTFYRLPTEAQWELAARAGGGATSEDLSQVAWFDANSGNEPHDVATKSPNAFGVFDMLGNVWEWCDDFYDADAYRFVTSDEPTGPKISRCLYRVLRGGSFLSDTKACAPAHRDLYQDSRSTKAIGFRIVVPAEMVPADVK